MQNFTTRSTDKVTIKVDRNLKSYPLRKSYRRTKVFGIWQKGFEPFKTFIEANGLLVYESHIDGVLHEQFYFFNGTFSSLTYKNCEIDSTMMTIEVPHTLRFEIGDYTH